MPFVTSTNGFPLTKLMMSFDGPSEESTFESFDTTEAGVESFVERFEESLLLADEARPATPLQMAPASLELGDDSCVRNRK